MPVDSDRLAERYRAATLQKDTQSVLLSRIGGTDQASDLSVPPNAEGFGRIRHFRRLGSNGWLPNPLPIDPAAKALGFDKNLPEIEAQIFQNAACNWRCWYCFVPFSLLRADPKKSSWKTAKELIDLYLREPERPRVLDLSGGQPELTPEWVLYVMDELEARELGRTVYLWSDDNLSADYYWRHLSEVEQQRIATFRNYGRVGCFKGFDEESFEFNTAASGDLFSRQFELMRRYLSSGIDMYAYVTLTSPGIVDLQGKMQRFVDRLQDIHENLPLRTIPLEVQVFTPVAGRLNEDCRKALKNQWHAVEAWQKEISDRFSKESRSMAITEISVVE